MIVTLITSVIGIGGLHHSIVGSIEVFTASLTSMEVDWIDYLHVQTWATLGNIVGGVFFVAFMKFSHVTAKMKQP
jgi:formate/nitrite transporter FocA (FNT family)